MPWTAREGINAIFTKKKKKHIIEHKNYPSSSCHWLWWQGKSFEIPKAIQRGKWEWGQYWKMLLCVYTILEVTHNSQENKSHQVILMVMIKVICIFLLLLCSTTFFFFLLFFVQINGFWPGFSFFVRWTLRISCSEIWIWNVFFYDGNINKIKFYMLQSQYHVIAETLFFLSSFFGFWVGFNII